MDIACSYVRAAKDGVYSEVVSAAKRGLPYARAAFDLTESRRPSISPYYRPYIWFQTLSSVRGAATPGDLDAYRSLLGYCGHTTALSPPLFDTDSPANTVINYWTAMNTGDFQRAWSLGGDNLQATLGSEAVFAANNADARGTSSVTITGVSGQVVGVLLSTSGHRYSGSYKVSSDNQAIVSANIRQTG